jgi:hypothetical protein
MVFTIVPPAAKMPRQSGRVAELADAKDLGSFGAILAGSTPVAPSRPTSGIMKLNEKALSGGLSFNERLAQQLATAGTALLEVAAILRGKPTGFAPGGGQVPSH